MNKTCAISRWLLAGTVILLATGVIVTWDPEPAVAGTYQVTACAGVTPLVNHSWQQFNHSQYGSTMYLETAANCGVKEITGFSSETSGLAAADVLGRGTLTPEGAVAGWTFTAPPGDTISAISMSRDLYNNGPGWLPQIVDSTGTPLPEETCPFNGTTGGCERSGSATRMGFNTTSLTIEILCSPASEELTACGGGSSLHHARAELNSATVTITDNQPPLITSTSGSLFAGGTVSGTLTGTIDSSDNSGIQSAILDVEGFPPSQQTSSCDYTLPAPCPASASNQFSLDTTTLPNGPHTIRASVIDAAGNQTFASPVQITVDNPTTSTGPSPGGQSGQGGSGSDDSTGDQPTQASPDLRILHVDRIGRTLHVAGSASPTLTGTLTLVVRYVLRSHGRAAAHDLRHTVRVDRGHWDAALRLPATALTERVTVARTRSTGWLAQTAVRYVYHLPARR